MADNMPTLQKELRQLGATKNMSKAEGHVDKMIALLTAARDEIAADPDSASHTMFKLQTPIGDGFDSVNSEFEAIYKTQKKFGKALDKSLPLNPLPTEHDAMADQSFLINRAIMMHLLREGQFNVASTFVEETAHTRTLFEPPHVFDANGDTDMTNYIPDDAADAFNEGSRPEFDADQNKDLQEKFENMYAILQALKTYNLDPAIQWARENSEELEAKGSNLEFELCRLLFVWLLKDSAPQPQIPAAIAYAKQHFSRFEQRHLREIQKLASAMVFVGNIADSPYASLFDTSSAFEDVAASFTREFCSLLGLSAESPLYVAATAGAIALPRLMKYIAYAKNKRTEWTTANELAFETPLPRSMIYHSIFVCPVSKEQTTTENPPMILPCGHVLAKFSLTNLTKGTKFKCPYCPSEGHLRDAREIIL